MISSLLQKPESGGTPAMASVPMAMVAKVIGMRRARPPMRRMSCSPPMAWITLPAHRKSSPLKNAWVTR